MQLFNSILLNIIFITFPLLCYFFYVILEDSKDNKISGVVLDLALLTALYLCINNVNITTSASSLVLLNIPLLVAYIKNKKGIAVILSCIIIYYHSSIYDYNIYLLISEYIIYYLLYFFVANKHLKISYLVNSFTIIKAFIFGIELVFTQNINLTNTELVTEGLTTIGIFYLITYLILIIINKVEQITNLHVTINDLRKESNIQKSLFRITHEIKNPIAVCKGYLDMFDMSSKKDCRKYVPIIKGEIDRTLTLIEDFSNYKKIEITKDILDITMLLEEVINSMQSLFESKQIKVIKSIPDEEIFISGDYNRLKQVFVNVIKNGVEAIKEKGSITIDMTKNEENISINIIDDGMGMDKKTLDRVGEIFYTTKQKGTGLGVNLSKEIINRHDGSIEYESEINKGTKVKIIIPVKNSN